MKRVTFYCMSGRHKITLTDPWEVILPAGRSGVKMKAYKLPCPLHRKMMYRIIGKA